MSEAMIPVACPQAQIESLRGEIQEAIQDVLSSGVYVLGKQNVMFEREFAAYLGTKHCVGVASGTDALALALRAVGISPGDEVITVSHSAVASVAAIEQIGAVPVLADIEKTSRCIDTNCISLLKTAKTRAVVPIHIYGQPAAMPEIMRIARDEGLQVVEDCAQAHGARIGGKMVGTFGHAAAFSFYPTKNLGALGDGGAVVTGCDETANRVRSLRQYGWNDQRVSLVKGVNSRLDELQAAILRVKLQSLESENVRRRGIASAYRSCLQNERAIAPQEIEGTTHAMHLFVVETDQRDAMNTFLRELDIKTAVHYPLAIHQQPAYSSEIRGRADCFPVTELLYRRILTLPMFPQMTDQQTERVCCALRKWSHS